LDFGLLGTYNAGDRLKAVKSIVSSGTNAETRYGGKCI
jgi:hypothetical protein